MPERYRIADLTVDAATRQVTRDGSAIELPGLSFDLLLALAHHAPRVVSGQELMELVWPGRVVNLETVAKRVELVRAALGDDSAEPRYIAVVRGHGYRLVAQMRPAADRRAQARTAAQPPATPPATAAGAPTREVPHRSRAGLWAGAALGGVAAVALSVWLLAERPDRGTALPPAAGGPSLAVLPFRNLSDDASNVYFSDGIAEEIRSVLTKVPRLRVASRTSSSSFRDGETPLAEIARTLNVDHILEGTVRRAGDRIRVSAELVDVASDSQVWSETYERDVLDVLAIQDEISRSIVAALRSALVQEESTAAAGTTLLTANFEAYQLFLRGRHLWNVRGESNIRQSIQLLGRAIELDPDFAQAHATLASAYATTTFYYAVPEPNALELAASEAERAMELDSTLSDPYAVHGMIAEQRMQWLRAEEQFRRAIELNGNDATARYWLGELHYVTGRTGEALAVMLEALELDPILPPLLIDIGDLHTDQGAIDKGCEYIRRVTQLTASVHPWLSLARCHEQAGNMAAAQEAERTAERLAGIQGQMLTLVHRAVEDPSQNAAARTALLEASRGGLGFIHYQRLLGDLDGAFDVIEAQLLQGNFNSLRDLWRSDATDLRAHSRFRTLVTRIGFVDYWRQTKWPDVCAPDGDSFRCD